MLIGINGYMRSGKDTVADYLVEKYGFTKISFAAPLKESVAALFGITLENIEEWKTDESMEVLIQRNLSSEIGKAKLDGKEPPLDLPHVRLDFRTFLKRYGTEAHREVPAMGYDFWVNLAMKQLERNPFLDYVFPDARFDNELKAIQHKGGYNIQLRRPSTDRTDGHASEVRPNPWFINETIWNDNTLECLYGHIDRIVNDGTQFDRAVNDWISK